MVHVNLGLGCLNHIGKVRPPLAVIFLQILMVSPAGWKESHFYSVPFWQAEANIILLAQMSFQLAPKFFEEQKLFNSSSVSWILKLLHLPIGQVKNRIQ